jgi:hypothetical protein
MTRNYWPGEPWQRDIRKEQAERSAVAQARRQIEGWTNEHLKQRLALLHDLAYLRTPSEGYELLAIQAELTARATRKKRAEIIAQHDTTPRQAESEARRNEGGGG